MNTMAISKALLLVLTSVLAHFSAAGPLKCYETDEVVVELSPDRINVSSVTEVTLACSANVEASFPQWEINSEAYDVTDLPLGYEAIGSNLTFLVYENLTRVRCAFVVYASGMFVDVCSNISLVTLTTPNVSLPFVPVEMCDPSDITFLLNEEQSSISWNINNYNENCTFIINVSSCRDSETDLCICNVTKVDGEHVRFPLDNCLRLGHQDDCLQYPGGVIVDVRYNHNACEGRTCNSRSYYLPESEYTDVVVVETDGIIIPNLSNNYCDLRRGTKMLCFESNIEEINGCTKENENQYFEMDCDKVECRLRVKTITFQLNGTVISIYCITDNCSDRRARQTQVFNLEILVSVPCEKCSQNATCEDGQCSCTAGYTGDGIICEMLTCMCSQYATCRHGECMCKDGYKGNGKECVRDISLIVGLSIGLGVPFIAAVIIIIIIAIVYYCRRKRYNTM